MSEYRLQIIQIISTKIEPAVVAEWANEQLQIQEAETHKSRDS